MKSIIHAKSLKIRFLVISLFNLILSLFFALITFRIFDIYRTYHYFFDSPVCVLFALLFILYYILLNLIMIKIILHPIRSLTKELHKFIRDYPSGNIDLDRYPEMANMLSSLLNLVDSVRNERDMALVIKKKSEAVIKTRERDVLTGLYNREFLERFLPDEISRARILNTPISLVMLDVDDFKHYNDTNGHPEGDRALKKVADLVQSSIRNYDLSIRYGGEEFCIIMPGTILANACMICERIRKVVADEYFESEEKQPNGNLTVSLGVATLSEHVSSEKELLKFADMALYQAKRSGKNKVCIYNPAP
jgi:diguanylate cyclase (GGDEF)-like protein